MSQIGLKKCHTLHEWFIGYRLIIKRKKNGTLQSTVMAALFSYLFTFQETLMKINHVAVCDNLDTHKVSRDKVGYSLKSKQIF